MNPDSAFNSRLLGHDAGPIRLESADDNRRLCAHMTLQIRRELKLLSRELDKKIFDQSAFLDNVRTLAIRSRHTRIRILVQDHERVVKQGHRLIELARRLTSSIEIRVPAKDWREHPENFLLADRSGYVYRSLGTDFEASADYHAPLMVEKLSARFETIWETSEPDSELRRLYL